MTGHSVRDLIAELGSLEERARDDPSRSTADELLSQQKAIVRELRWRRARLRLEQRDPSSGG